MILHNRGGSTLSGRVGYICILNYYEKTFYLAFLAQKFRKGWKYQNLVIITPMYRFNFPILRVWDSIPAPSATTVKFCSNYGRNRIWELWQPVIVFSYIFILQCRIDFMGYIMVMKTWPASCLLPVWCRILFFQRSNN